MRISPIVQANCANRNLFKENKVEDKKVPKEDKKTLKETKEKSEETKKEEVKKDKQRVILKEYECIGDGKIKW